MDSSNSAHSFVQVQLGDLPKALILPQFLMQRFLCWLDDLSEYVNGTIPSLLASSHHAGVLNADSLAEGREKHDALSCAPSELALPRGQ